MRTLGEEMTDSLGFRKKFGVVAPSTNTAVQPEYEAMRPRGVTNHFARIHIPDDPIRDDADFDQLMNNIRRTMFEAIDRVMTGRITSFSACRRRRSGTVSRA